MVFLLASSSKVWPGFLSRSSRQVCKSATQGTFTTILSTFRSKWVESNDFPSSSTKSLWAFWCRESLSLNKNHSTNVCIVHSRSLLLLTFTAVKIRPIHTTSTTRTSWTLHLSPTSWTSLAYCLFRSTVQHPRPRSAFQTYLLLPLKTGSKIHVYLLPPGQSSMKTWFSWTRTTFQTISWTISSVQDDIVLVSPTSPDLQGHSWHNVFTSESLPTFLWSKNAHCTNPAGNSPIFPLSTTGFFSWDIQVGGNVPTVQTKSSIHSTLSIKRNWFPLWVRRIKHVRKYIKRETLSIFTSISRRQVGFYTLSTNPLSYNRLSPHLPEIPVSLFMHLIVERREVSRLRSRYPDASFPTSAASTFLFFQHVCCNFPKVSTNEQLTYITISPGSRLIVFHFFDRFRPISKVMGSEQGLFCIPHTHHCIPLASARRHSRRTRKGRKENRKWNGFLPNFSSLTSSSSSMFHMQRRCDFGQKHLLTAFVLSLPGLVYVIWVVLSWPHMVDELFLM